MQNERIVLIDMLQYTPITWKYFQVNLKAPHD